MCISKQFSQAHVFYRKIKDIKQYTVDEGQKMNESLKAYQLKFEKQLKGLHQDLTVAFTNETIYQ